MTRDYMSVGVWLVGTYAMSYGAYHLAGPNGVWIAIGAAIVARTMARYEKPN